MTHDDLGGVEVRIIDIPAMGSRQGHCWQLILPSLLVAAEGHFSSLLRHTTALTVEYAHLEGQGAQAPLQGRHLGLDTDAIGAIGLDA